MRSEADTLFVHHYLERTGIYRSEIIYGISVEILAEMNEVDRMGSGRRLRGDCEYRQKNRKSFHV